MRQSRVLPAAAAALLLLVACGGDDDDTADAGAEATGTAADEMAEDETSQDEASEDGMDDMSEDEMGEMSEDGHGDGDDDHGDMDMGSADTTPASEVGGELVQGEFQLLDGAPNGLGFQDASGTAYLARTDDGTVATLEVEGLRPDTAFVSHVHADACSNEGGPHYRFDPDGSDVPPNEIHLDFTTDADGAVTWTATNDQVAGDEARSLVIHARGGDQTKALCADLAA